MSDDEERKAMLDNLSATQQRCNELLEEKRAAVRELEAEKRLVQSYRLAVEILAGELNDARDVLMALVDKSVSEEGKGWD